MRDPQTRAANDGPTSASKTTRERPPTSADVARLARVSQATVSLVLNDVGKNRFSEETRERVLSAAEALGYVPHALASSLRSGESNLVLITFLSLPTGARLAIFYEQVATELNALGYTVLFHVDRSLRGGEAARSWASLRPVGVVVDGDRLTNEAVKVMRRAGVKAIVALGSRPVRTVPTVELADDEIGRCAAEYLAGKGYSRLAVVVPVDPELRGVGLQRLHSAAQVAAERGITVEQVDLQLEEADAARVVATWKRGASPDAVFGYNDIYAGLLLSALQDAGVRVPQEVAVMGCDNLRMREFLRPRLTTVDFPSSAYARRLAAMVDAMVHDRAAQPDQSGEQAQPYVIVGQSA